MISLTKKELANAAGYTYRRLYDIDKALPPDKKLFVDAAGGKYDLAMFVQRWVEYNVSLESDSTDDLDVVKARHEVIKTQKTELEVAKMRGQLVDVSDVKRLWGDIINAVENNIIHLPNRAAPMLRMMESTEQIAEIIDLEVRRILDDIAETPLPDYANDKEDEDAEE